MSARVLLVSVNREDQPHPVYPLALEHLAAALRAAGHEALLLDVRKLAADGVPLVDAVRDARPDLVGVSSAMSTTTSPPARRTTFPISLP
jgi:hypothetical protein